MIGRYRSIGDLAARYHSIQDVITIDTVILQTSGIELADGAGLAGERAMGDDLVIPDIIKAPVLLT
jgi:hypothetical protein